MANLSGKVALVTGAGQGVGQGIALALAGAGATVAVTGRTESKLADTLKILKDRGGKGLAITCDVFKAEDITRTVARTVEALGGIDILVNNAYDGAFGPLLSLDDDAFMRGINAGPLASFRFMRACHHIGRHGRRAAPEPPGIGRVLEMARIELEGILVREPADVRGIELRDQRRAQPQEAGSRTAAQPLQTAPEHCIGTHGPDVDLQDPRRLRHVEDGDDSSTVAFSGDPGHRRHDAAG